MPQLKVTITEELMSQLEGYQVKAKVAKMVGVLEQMAVHCEQTGFLKGLEPVEGTSEGTVFSEEGES